MDLGLRGKVAMVAASSRGLGRAAALALAQEGASVSLCARGEDDLSATADDIRAATGSNVLAVPANVTARGDLDRWVDRTAEELGPPVIVVTNAGGPSPGNFFDVNEDNWRRAFDLTLMSTVHLAYKTVPYMRDAGWGRLITVTSFTVKMPADNLLLSNSIRAAVIGLTKSLSNEFAQEGITVNSILPGWTRTDRVEELLQSIADRDGITVDQAAANIANDIPARRMALPQEFGDVVAFLASERASYVNGVSLLVDGGIARGIG
jgi:3-oxoacyl-[acyl-carrier protein] reductase